MDPIDIFHRELQDGKANAIANFCEATYAHNVLLYTSCLSLLKETDVKIEDFDAATFKNTLKTSLQAMNICGDKVFTGRCSVRGVILLCEDTSRHSRDNGR